MSVYRVECAKLAEPHSHVLGLQVRKLRPKKKTYANKVKYFPKSKVIKKIDNDGDTFRTTARDGSTTVRVIHMRCRTDCPEETLRTVADDSTMDNLDYMPCR